MSRTVLSVPDISCEHCERTITGALSGQPGVNKVKVDVTAKTVTLDYDEAATNLETIGTVLDDEGYPVRSAVPA